MTQDSLDAAIAEAGRFLERAQALRSVCADSGHRILAGSRESAAVRRASLDLTRALADLRRRPSG